MIFNKQKYHKANKLNSVVCFERLSGDHSSFIRSSFVIENNQAISLPNAPYCGLEISKTNATDLQQALEEIQRNLFAKGCNKILIKQAPALLSDTTDTIHNTLTTFATSVSHEINHFIKLEQFEDRIHSMQKRKIKKCKEESLSFNTEPIVSASEVYEFITKCRLQQGLNVNIAKEHFVNLINKLSKDYTIYTLRDRNGIIYACTVTLKVSDQTVYNYLPAFDRAYKSLSPLAYLQYMLCHNLSARGFTTLDLGISSINGIPQESLINFKEKMGGIRQYRYTYLIENQN